MHDIIRTIAKATAFVICMHIFLRLDTSGSLRHRLVHRFDTVTDSKFSHNVLRRGSEIGLPAVILKGKKTSISVTIDTHVACEFLRKHFKNVRATPPK